MRSCRGSREGAGDATAVQPPRRRMTPRLAYFGTSCPPRRDAQMHSRAVLPVKKPSPSLTPGGGRERANGAVQAARSGAGATTRAVRVGFRLAAHIIAGRSNSR